MPNDQARPYIGHAGQMEATDEEQIQVDVRADRLKAVLAALRAAHPYEEIGYDLYEKTDISAFL